MYSRQSVPWDTNTNTEPDYIHDKTYVLVFHPCVYVLYSLTFFWNWKIHPKQLHPQPALFCPLLFFLCLWKPWAFTSIFRCCLETTLLAWCLCCKVYWSGKMPINASSNDVLDLVAVIAILHLSQPCIHWAVLSGGGILKSVSIYINLI